MFNLKRLERLIIAVLVGTLLTGLALAAYKKSHPPKAEITQFDPEDYRAQASAKEPVVKVNINTAGLDELAALNGVGPAIAGRIIEYRSRNGYFLSNADIKKVRGLGDVIFDKIKDSISTE